MLTDTLESFLLCVRCMRLKKVSIDSASFMVNLRFRLRINVKFFLSAYFSESYSAHRSIIIIPSSLSDDTIKKPIAVFTLLCKSLQIYIKPYGFKYTQAY